VQLTVSNSGGRTSAYMTKRLLDDGHELDVVFANTGQEHERTLEFIRKCDEVWGFNTTWIEAAIDPRRGVGVRHKVVSFETASRNGEPFEALIAKEGIPNQSRPRCSHRLKALAMASYRREAGTDGLPVAIGIRADERRRVSKDAVASGIVYPWVDWFPTDKPTILAWFRKQPFDLELPEHLGNCTWCWKKTISKHLRLIRECPEIYDFPRRMEREYGHIAASDEAGKYARHVFFRGNRSTDDLFEIASHATQIDLFREIIEEDATNECGESCEAFQMETPA